MFSPDGQRLVTASGDKTARVWEAASGQPPGHPPGPSRGRIGRCVQPGRPAPGHGQLRTRPRGCGRPPVGSSWPPCRAIKTRMGSAAFSPDGQRLVTASSDKTARVWERRQWAAPGQPAQGHQDGGQAARSARTASAWSRPVGTRRRGSGRPPVGSPWPPSQGHQDSVGPRLQPGRPARGHRQLGQNGAGLGGRQWAAPGHPAGHQDSVWASRLQPGRPAHRHRQRGQDRAGLGRRPMGSPWPYPRAIKTAFRQSCSARTASAWSPPVRTRRRGCGTPPVGSPWPSLQGHQERVQAAAFSPDGQRLVTASDGKTARVWDAAVGSPWPPSGPPRGRIGSRVQPGRPPPGHGQCG